MVEEGGEFATGRVEEAWREPGEANGDNYPTFRNEHLDDIRGPRAGYKPTYSQHTIAAGRRIGNNPLIRSKPRFEHAYIQPAYNSRTQQTQIVLAIYAIVKFRVRAEAPESTEL